MRVAALLASILAAVAGMLLAGQARAWTENHVTGDEVRLELDATGKAVVVHRFTLKMNGSKRQKSFQIHGVDADAQPLPNSYVVPAKDALSTSLESAIPLKMTLRTRSSGDGPPIPVLDLEVDDERGLWRGVYVWVVRYRTDLRGRGLIRRDGAMVRVDWTGPIWEDGFDNARVTFVVPSSPTPPRAVEPPRAHGADDALPALYLAEVRRGGDHDELELMRTYAPEKEAIGWAIRVDLRALLPVAEPDAGRGEAVPVEPAPKLDWRGRRLEIGVVAGVFLLLCLVLGLKIRQLRVAAEAARAVVPPAIPLLPAWARVPLFAAALLAGLALQLYFDRPTWGAWCVLFATALAAHGVARTQPAASMRGPGRWLPVGEDELGEPPRPRGAWLDSSTRIGKLLLVLSLGGVGVAVWWLGRDNVWRAALTGCDAVVLLALFGTGRIGDLPPDMAVEPARALRRIVKQLRKKKGVGELRIVPRIRVPRGELDPDEVRLLVVPKLPMRGFLAIEIGVTYALGVGSRLAMPEVLLRVVADSPCDEAARTITRRARITPGRKPDERVFAFAPRLPTARMTAEIAAALAVRVTDREALARRVDRPKPELPAKAA